VREQQRGRDPRRSRHPVLKLDGGTASELQTASDSRRMLDELDLALESLSYVHGGFSAPSVEEAKRRIRSVRDLLRRSIEDPGRNTSG